MLWGDGMADRAGGRVCLEWGGDHSRSAQIHNFRFQFPERNRSENVGIRRFSSRNLKSNMGGLSGA